MGTGTPRRKPDRACRFLPLPEGLNLTSSLASGVGTKNLRGELFLWHSKETSKRLGATVKVSCANCAQFNR